MAKNVVIVEDRPTYARILKNTLDDALKYGALEAGDVIHTIRAHKDAHIYPHETADLPYNYSCSTFGELKRTIEEIKGDRLLLLDVDLVGVHGYEGAGLTQTTEIPSFYASLTNQHTARTTILLYSEGIRPEQKAAQIVKYSHRRDYIASLQNSPINSKEAIIIAKGGLDLFFNHPLEEVPIRLKLEAYYRGHCTKDDFENWFEAVNSGGMYPAGTLRWLMSDWLRKILDS